MQFFPQAVVSLRIRKTMSSVVFFAMASAAFFHMPDLKTETQQQLDAALAASFPASDPPAMTAPGTTSDASVASEEAQRRPVDFYRVVPREQSGKPFDRASNQSGGRWSTPGRPAVYASMSPAGAVLEFLAHVDGEKAEDLAIVSACLPAGCVVQADALPPRWRDYPYRGDVRAYGDSWLSSGRSLALCLPSVLCEQARNLLINPDHPDAQRIFVTRAESFSMDARLLK